MRDELWYGFVFLVAVGLMFWLIRRKG